MMTLWIKTILAGVNPLHTNTIKKYIKIKLIGLIPCTPVKTGKPAHSDLRQGKMTLLIIYTLKHGSSAQVARLKQIWGKRNLTESEAEEARKIVKDTGSLDYSRDVSKEW